MSVLRCCVVVLHVSNASVRACCLLVDGICEMISLRWWSCVLDCIDGIPVFAGNSCAALLPDKQPTAASCNGNSTGEWREPGSWGIPVSSGSDNSLAWIIFVVVGVIAVILILGIAGYMYKRRQRLEVERTTAGAVVEAVSMSPIQPPNAASGSRHEIEPLASGVLNESPTQPVDLEGQSESPITLKLIVDGQSDQKIDSETLLASNQKVTVSKADSYAQN